MRRLVRLTLIPIVVTVACTPQRDPLSAFATDGAGEIVVDAVLLVDDPFPTFILSRSLTPDEPFSLGRAGIVGAAVSIRSDADTIDYTDDPSQNGVYVATNSIARVRPETTYRLRVEVDGEVVRATTTTPPRFSIPDWLLLDEGSFSVRDSLMRFGGSEPDSIVFEANSVTYGDGLLEARFARPDVPAFQVGILSLDLDSDFVIDPEFFDEGDFENLDRNVSSPPLFATDGTVRLPWFAIYFEGRYRIRIFAVDENWYDLVRSMPALGGQAQGFGGNIGEGSDRPIFRVDGGIGLFGSGAVDEIGLTILPSP